MSADLERAARHYGLTTSYVAPGSGAPRPVPPETLRLILRGLGVDPEVAPSGASAPVTMQVPEDARCFLPPSLQGAPGWGVFCQLYELRSQRNWGIGDFADLAELTRICGAARADFLGVNPLHALFTADPGRISPFSPSNRRFLNPLYIAVDALPGAIVPPEIAELRRTELVDYVEVTRLKLRALQDIFATRPHDGAEEEAQFETFCAEGEEALRRHALFEALSHHMVAQGHGAGWHGWPEPLRDPGSAQVAELARKLAREITFHLWLQWVARRQLGEAAAQARMQGMRIGLYLDLAVGEAPDGSSTWSGAAAALPRLSIGAPPDIFATGGQNWGLAAPSPTALAQTGFAPFREVIAAQLRDAGALRIDHVMALWQLFLIPEGAPAAAGTHLRQPFAALLDALAELSRRHGAVIIGEDLGFVPEGFRTAMAAANILSYRILYFEQSEQGFLDSVAYPAKALACISTHDMPVLSGWWQGIDIALRREHGLVDAETSRQHSRHRASERAALLHALARNGALETSHSATAPSLPDPVLVAAHRFLARTPSLLCALRLADLVGPTAPTNLPGTIDAYPNWRPRSPTRLEDLAEHPQFQRIAALMRAERPRPGGAVP
ncbi:4-alpha-glucanotransferase [Sulfitobacter aestuarii]|uniref:4-alpha-glucanotransferase n=1 Tax=Sulfitobacter aestuarii TaxID=2161676 RepID=A0ABW5TWZ4_9RHOB